MIIPIFSKLGTITFVGSYALQLLYRRDIDLFVTSEICDVNSATSITKQLLDLLTFQTVGFADWTVQTPPNNLKGCYWELVYFNGPNRWKFDIWYTAEKDIQAIIDTSKFKEQLLQKPELREQILKLKSDLYNGDTYVNNMNGFKIYEQVLGKIK